MRKLDLGKATVTPARPITAGAYVTLEYTYTAGCPIDDSGFIKIVFRQMGDFAVPQFDDPSAANWCSVSVSGTSRIIPRWDPKGHTRPWSKALYLQVRLGHLETGEQIKVIFGDTSGGGAGWRAQTFAEDTFEFKTFVDPYATYQFKELPTSPTIRIVPGDPVRAVCIGPSKVQAGKKFTCHLKLEDTWGNPTAKPRAFTPPPFRQIAIQTVRLTDAKTGLAGTSNPIDVLEAPPKLNAYWADLHGQSEETIGTNTVDDYFRFARDYGLLDIAAHQGNDFQVTDEFWLKLNRTTRKYFRPVKFVTFPGYEWSGTTPAGGDRNVYYKAEGERIMRSSRDLLSATETRYVDALTAKALFANLRGREAFIFAHAGGRWTDLRTHDPNLEVAIEVHSAWGTFEWLLDDALRLGYRVGICANSDGHKCRPGASYPGGGKFASLGGLTCVLSERLTRDSIFKAIKGRHFYATTGNRPLLEVFAVTGDGRRAMMGDVMTPEQGRTVLSVRAVGTAPIDRVEVRNGTDMVGVMRPYAAGDLGRRIKVLWSGAQVRGRGRMVNWDGSLSVRNNRIVAFRPINFWNPDLPMKRTGPGRLAWRSATTGGVAGVILDLKTPKAGKLSIDTAQLQLECSIREIGLGELLYEAGGLGKQMQIYRLPDRRESNVFQFEIPLSRLRTGDNPIYVKVIQEDGHMAWSSPIYLVKQK